MTAYCYCLLQKRFLYCISSPIETFQVWFNIYWDNQLRNEAHMAESDRKIKVIKRYRFITD